MHLRSQHREMTSILIVSKSSCYGSIFIGGSTKVSRFHDLFQVVATRNFHSRGEWPSGLYSLRQVTEVKLGRVRSDSDG